MTKFIRSLLSLVCLLLWLLVAPHFGPSVMAQKAAPAPAKTPTEVQAKVSETIVDSSIPDDPAVDKMLEAYSPKVHSLDLIIGRLNGELRKNGIGAGSLGNFVTDGMRFEASRKLGKPIDIAIMNGGGLRRSTIGEGELRARDIFELLPFENALMTLEVNGQQLLGLLGVVVSGREAQSGARLIYITKADKSFEMESALLVDSQGHEKKIDPEATYMVVTIDYLVNVGGPRYGVLQQGKNISALGITLRDGIIDYVKSETAAGREIKPRLDGRFVMDRAHSVVSGEAPPQ